MMMEKREKRYSFLYNTYIHLGPAKKEIVDCCMENVENTSQCPENTHDRWRKLPPTFSTFLSSKTFIAEKSTSVNGWQLYKWMGEWIEKEIYFWKMPSSLVDVFHFPSFLFPSHLLTVFFNFFLLLYYCSWCRCRYYPLFFFNKEYSCAHLPNGSPEGWISCFCTFACRIERFANIFYQLFCRKREMGRLFFILLCLYFHIFPYFGQKWIFVYLRDCLCYRRFEFWWK